jgi:PleD family two-component response regulator
MRQQDVLHADAFPGDEFKEPIDLVTRIDDDALASAGAGHDEPVLLERRHGLGLDYDHRVILAILDDLLFTSKIRGAAVQAGVSLTVARSKEAALAAMREQTPSLVILDLNNSRTDPIGIITAMQADARLQSIAAVGYVSHVDTATIEDARRAGLAEVMPRSAFNAKLPEIVGRAV